MLSEQFPDLLLIASYRNRIADGSRVRLQVLPQVFVTIIAAFDGHTVIADFASPQLYAVIGVGG